MATETELRELSPAVLNELAPSDQRVAVCLYGPRVYAKQGIYQNYDVLIVCESYANGLRAHLRFVDGNQINYLIADKSLIESDVQKGTLGDFLTDKLLYPFRPVANDAYVEQLSLQGKSRIVKEEARDLVLEYEEMCRGLVAKPEFFGLSRMRKRARIFVPSMEEYLRLMDPAVREQNLSKLRESFRRAISEMGSDIVELEGDFVTITDGAIDRWLKAKTSERVVNILRQSQRAFNSFLTKGRSVYLNMDLIARELYSPIKLGLGPAVFRKEPENPRNYLFLLTSEGLISFNERTKLEDIISKLRPDRPVTISPLAGVLNEVFLITAGKEQFVAKRFTDWHGFKWFTLNLVSFGSKLFAVSGKVRMTNEYGMNRYLARKGLNVPEVIHVNLKERTLVERYVPGVPLNEVVIDAITKSALTKSQYRIGERLGETLAEVHKIGVSIGDVKPENFVSKDGEIYIVDLEQAGKHGDFAWDIAELLFYTGHYSKSPTPTRGLTEMIQAFIKGYLRKGMAPELRRAAGVRYARVFSLWTPAPIIFEISRMLREPDQTVGSP